MKVFQKIGEDKKFVFTSLAIFFLIILFFNLSFFFNQIIGLIFSLFYLFIISLWLGRILNKILNLEKEFKFLFGLFLSFYLIAFGLAVPIIFYKISKIYFYLFLLIFTLIISFLNHRLQKRGKFINQDNSFQTINKEEEIKIHPFFYILYFIFYLLAFFLLIKARTGENLVSPWQVISPYYLYLWLVISFFTALFVFSRKKIITILLIIILSSLLLHAYLPIVHENNFGVDRWRQLGAERRLIFGQIESPSLFGEKIKYKKIGPISLPEVFFTANKLSYASNWGLTIGLSWLTSIDIFYLDLFLIFILWSIFLPILTFKLVDLIFDNKKIALLTAFCTLIPFPFQTDGAITLPKTVSFLFFIFALIIILKYLKGEKKLLPFVIFLFFLLYFHYLLFLILTLEIFVFGLILKTQPKKLWFKKIILIFLFIVFSLSLVFLDRLSQTSFFQYKISEIFQIFPLKIKDFIKKIILGQYFYSFNQNQALFPLSFNLIFIILAWFLVIIGLIKGWKKNLGKLLGIFLIILIFNQFFSVSLMKNYRLLARRSSMFIVFLLVIFLAVGLKSLMKKIKLKPVFKVVLFAIFLAIFSTTTYASGPNDLGTVTSDELAVAKFLWQEIKKEPTKKFCVLDNSWRLLALESESGIIAGNFPTDPIDFVQKEKDELYKKMIYQPSKEILDKSLKITGANTCFFVTEQRWLKAGVFDKIKEILGKPTIINNTYIWRYEK